MSIRNAAKAVILKDGCLLLQHCRWVNGREYYDLPGGGQHVYETMEEAVVRECLEETGYTVAVERFLALHEEIWMDEAYRKQYPDHTHRIYHTFLCTLTDAAPVPPSEVDFDQIGFDWIPLAQLSQIDLLPSKLAQVLPRLLAEGTMAYLPLHIVDMNPNA